MSPIPARIWRENGRAPPRRPQRVLQKGASFNLEALKEQVQKAIQARAAQ
jgi:hypothetical protein